MSSDIEGRRIIIHVDFDYFYAQCEELRNPRIKSRPVVICAFSGRSEDSGVVSTANYIARTHGVKSGIPITHARKKLASIDETIFLPMDLDYYKKVSSDAMSIIRKITANLEQIGLDECYSDISELADNDYDDAYSLVSEIKSTIFSQIGLTCSIGISLNKVLAKMASDYKKPDSITMVQSEDVHEFLDNRKISDIPRIGPKTINRLNEMNIGTISELSKVDISILTGKFGQKKGIYLHDSSRGKDKTPVTDLKEKKQISKIITLRKDQSEEREIIQDLDGLCAYLYEKLLREQKLVRNITLILISNKLEMSTRSKSLKLHSNDKILIYDSAKTLLSELVMQHRRNSAGKFIVRRLGLRLSDFKDNLGQNTLLDFFK